MQKGERVAALPLANLSFYFRADLAALQVAIQAQFARNQNNQAIQAQIDFYCILLEESQ